MIRQRGITIIELILACIYLAIAVSAFFLVGRKYGVLGIVGLTAGAGILIALYALRSRRLVALLFKMGLPLFPFLVVGAHFYRPEVFLLRLAAVATVLVVGDVLFQGLCARFLYRGGTYLPVTGGEEDEGFTLHFGHFLLVVVVGTVLAVWWGWLSTGIVLFLDGAWQGVAGLIYCRTVEGLPPSQE